MIKNLHKLRRDKTSRQVVINTFGNYLNIAFTAFYSIILVRVLNPVDYGVLSVLLGITYVMANILEFGTTATIYSTVPMLYENQSKRMYQFIKSTFFYQSLFAFIVLAILMFAFPWLDKNFFKTEATNWQLFLTTISILFFIWQNFLTNILFAAKRFLRANLYINGANIAKTVFIFIMLYLGKIDVGSIIFAFGVVGPATFFLLMLWRNSSLLGNMRQADIKIEEFKLKYTMTYFAASQFYNLGLRMDLFLLSYFGLKEQVGYYALSQKIVLTTAASIISISQVLSPKFAVIKNKAQAIKQIKNGLLYMVIPSFVLILIALTPSWVFEIVFTKDFAESTRVTHILALVFILNAFGTIPNLYLLYTLRKPVYILIANIIFFLTITIGSYLLIPKYGMYGPPFAILIAFVLSILVEVLVIYKHRNSLP